MLPAWDVACGLYAALAVTAALRHRDATGRGQRVGIPLENVALATAGNLSFLTEVMVNGVARERIGNSIYGQYGQTVHQRRRGVVHDRRADRAALPRSDRAHRYDESRCRAG